MRSVRIDITQPVRKAFDTLDDVMSGQSYDDDTIIRLALTLVQRHHGDMSLMQCTDSSAKYIRSLLTKDRSDEDVTESDEWISQVVISHLAPDLQNAIRTVLGGSVRITTIGRINLSYSRSRNLHVSVDLGIEAPKGPPHDTSY